MTQKTTSLTPEESAIANRDLKAGDPTGVRPVTPTPGVTPASESVPKTHASSKPGDPNISEDERLKNAGSPYKDVNFGNRSSMDE